MKRMSIGLLSAVNILSAHMWEGHHYQATCRPQYEMATFVMSQLPDKEYKTILDIGCGSGDFTIELSKAAEYVLGVDYSESMILQAHEEYGNYPNVAFKVGDIRRLDDINQQFDLVTAFHPIQWIPAHNQIQAFEQMAKHVKLGGICVVLVSDRYNIFYGPLMKAVQQEKWKHYFPAQLEPWNWQTVASIADSYKQVNLRPLKVMIWYKQYNLADKQAFYAFMANWFYNANHFQYLPEEKREEFFNEILEDFLVSISYSGKGVVEFASPFVVGIAQK